MADPTPTLASPTRNGASPAPLLSRRSRRWLILILILWLAFLLRVWQLDVLPPGLHYDEAFNGHLARDVLRNVERPIFFTDNFGEEPMHMYTEAVLFEFLPELPWTIRLTSAIYGVLFIAAVYACARALFPNSDVLALSSTFIAATLYWAINFSRIGIETNTLPFVLTLSAAALAHAYRKMTWGWVIGAGFFIGATIYTYLASRLWLVAVFLWFLYLVIFHFHQVRTHFPKWVAIGMVALVTLAPLILFFVENPIAFTGRSGTVFTPETLLTNLVRTAGMFFFFGDTDPRDNLIGRPALDVLLSIFFMLGLVLSLVRFRKPYYGFLVIWLVIMCLPSALTEFAPNFRRAIGALPATVLLCGIGFEWLWMRASGIRKSVIRGQSSVIGNPSPISSLQSPISNLQSPVSSLKSPFFPLLLILALALSAFWSARAYFVDWASSSGLFYSFDVGLLQVGKALAARPADERLYLTPDYAEHYTVAWALDGRPVSSFDGRRIEVLPDSSRAATYGIITREDTVSAARVPLYPGFQELESFVDAAGAPYARLFHQNPGPPRQVTQSNGILFGDFAELVQDSSTGPLRRGETSIVTLAWSAHKPAQRNYTVFVQLVGPLNPATGSVVWAQVDRQPGEGTYPTTAWHDGEVIGEEYQIKVPPEARPGNYRILVGMYELETNERVNLSNKSGAPIEDNALVINSFVLE